MDVKFEAGFAYDDEGFVGIVRRTIGDNPPEEAEVLNEHRRVAHFATADEAIEATKDRIRLMMANVQVQAEGVEGLEVGPAVETEGSS
jgi:hypothetical protein